MVVYFSFLPRQSDASEWPDESNQFVTFILIYTQFIEHKPGIVYIHQDFYLPEEAL